MKGGAAPVFLPMDENDLDWVVVAEKDLHAFPWTRGNFVDSLAAGYSAWVMRIGDNAVGYAVVLLVMDEAHLLNISVQRAFQGCGLGRRLLDFVADTARQRGAAQLFLEVRPSNLAALGLYEAYGFDVIGRRRAYYPAHDGREDAIVMRKSL